MAILAVDTVTSDHRIEKMLIRYDETSIPDVIYDLKMLRVADLITDWDFAQSVLQICIF